VLNIRGSTYEEALIQPGKLTENVFTNSHIRVDGLQDIFRYTGTRSLLQDRAPKLLYTRHITMEKVNSVYEKLNI
jgi:hypothetical protein